MRVALVVCLGVFGALGCGTSVPAGSGPSGEGGGGDTNGGSGGGPGVVAGGAANGGTDQGDAGVSRGGAPPGPGPSPGSGAGGQAGMPNVPDPKPDPAQAINIGPLKSKPHIVVFISDDHARLDSQPYDPATKVKTPNLQRLATDGVTFTHAYVASPSCAPSRAAMLTGMHSSRNGAMANHTEPREELKKLPMYLTDLGYTVGAFGKVAHGGPDVAMQYGFEHTGASAQNAVQFIQSHDPNKPLLLFVGDNRPHLPWDTCDGYSAQEVNLPPSLIDNQTTRQHRTCYYSEITAMDAAVGGVYDAAKARLGENLVFMYTSDHGAAWPFSKWTVYDAGIRTPLLMTWPGVLKPGSTSPAMVSWIDFLATFVEMAGGVAPAVGTGSDSMLDSQSMLKLLSGERTTHRDFIFAQHTGDGGNNSYPQRVVTDGRFKYITNLFPDSLSTTPLDQNDRPPGLMTSWTQSATQDPNAAKILCRYHRRPPAELYDLEQDRYELNNLIDDPRHAATAAKLKAELERWMSAVGDDGSARSGTPKPLGEFAGCVYQ